MEADSQVTDCKFRSVSEKTEYLCPYYVGNNDENEFFFLSFFLSFYYEEYGISTSTDITYCDSIRETSRTKRKFVITYSHLIFYLCFVSICGRFMLFIFYTSPKHRKLYHTHNSLVSHTSNINEYMCQFYYVLCERNVTPDVYELQCNKKQKPDDRRVHRMFWFLSFYDLTLELLATPQKKRA